MEKLQQDIISFKITRTGGGGGEMQNFVAISVKRTAYKG